MKAVAVVSNKGGCGKSCVSANLALELHRRGVKVGLLDADIDSPYISEMLGAKGKVDLDASRRAVPVRYEGMPFISFANWTPEEFGGATMAGEMHSRWIEDQLRFADWGDTDLLVIDLPAGTSRDEYILVRDVLKEDFLGLIAVALPNVVSGLQRVYNTAAYHRLRILGVVENMSGSVFGSGAVEGFCKPKGLRVLGSIPLDERVPKLHQEGKPRLPADMFGPIRAAADAVMDVAGLVKEARA